MTCLAPTRNRCKGRGREQCATWESATLAQRLAFDLDLVRATMEEKYWSVVVKRVAFAQRRCGDPAAPRLASASEIADAEARLNAAWRRLCS